MKNSCFFFIYFSVVLLGINVKAQYSEDEWNYRDTWMDVSKIYELAAIEKGSQVADIGCHEGYLTVRLSERVGESGQVFAVDVREDRLDELKLNIKKRGLKNINSILGDYDDPKLPIGLLDVVIVMDTYHEIDDYMTVLEHIKRALKPGGRILILEKLKSGSKDKSRDDQMDAHTLSVKYVKKELEEVGFTITEHVADFGQWENDKDKTMWLLVGTKVGN